MTTLQRQFGAVLVGGGPAGMAVLLAAHKEGRLTELLQQGLLIIEKSAQIGCGTLGNYIINSDSTGETFVAPLRTGSEVRLHQILDSPIARRLTTAGPDAISLIDAAELQSLIGHALQAIISDYPNCAVLTGCAARYARMQSNGSWQINAIQHDGSELAIQTRCVILATGASQPFERLQREYLSGVSVTQRWGDRIMQSNEVLSLGGPAEVSARLRRIANPRVSILGGSTSAMSVAHLLLHQIPGIRFGEGAITLVHRRQIRVYYTSPEEALADGYTEFGPDDLCPITNRVYRLAGLRLQSRELLMQLRGIGGCPREARIRMHLLQPEDSEAISLIDSADLIVTAFGYRPNALRIQNSSGANVVLFSETGSSAPLVDGACRVMDQHGRPIPGLFGIGLAAGFVPHGKLGGEPSFRGQANGLWLWQNDIGSIIVNAVIPTAPISMAMFNKPLPSPRASEEVNRLTVPVSLGMKA